MVVVEIGRKAVENDAFTNFGGKVADLKVGQLKQPGSQLLGYWAVRLIRKSARQEPRPVGAGTGRVHHRADRT